MMPASQSECVHCVQRRGQSARTIMLADAWISCTSSFASSRDGVAARSSITGQKALPPASALRPGRVHLHPTQSACHGGERDGAYDLTWSAQICASCMGDGTGEIAQRGAAALRSLRYIASF